MLDRLLKNLKNKIVLHLKPFFLGQNVEIHINNGVSPLEAVKNGSASNLKRSDFAIVAFPAFVATSAE
jgi:hypothetical protein